VRSEASVQGSETGHLAAAILVLAFVAAIGLQAVRERTYPKVASPVDELYFTSGDAVGHMALSFKALLADVYWIRAVQYFGSTRLNKEKAEGYDLLYPLLDVTTSLDPAFNIAYRFGAIFLAEGFPNGPGRPDLAVKLLDKGFRQNPHKWQYLYDKAFVYYWAMRDYKSASTWFAEAAKVPHSPDWMPGLAAFMLTQGGDRRSSRFLWTQILQSAEQHDYMKKNAEWRLAQLDVLDVLDQINLRLDRYAQMTGQGATDWAPVIARGLLRDVPRDPDGLPFVIDPSTGKATVARNSKYYPLPDEPEPVLNSAPRPPAS
jgi:hypothetical protein